MASLAACSTALELMQATNARPYRLIARSVNWHPHISHPPSLCGSGSDSASQQKPETHTACCHYVHATAPIAP